MSVLEEELEILLGELHIKMKGLIGFARLCPGDQYEVVVRLGRQRWRTRGRIQSDDTQSWDKEEMVFLPHIHHNFEIKVTEAKGLGWLLVGMVTCASADFFLPRSQMMVVEVTELGTMKLLLEVTWSPFDSSDRMRPLSVSRQSVSSRMGSVHSWTAPSTPSFTEKYYMQSMRELQDRGSSSLVLKGRPIRGGVSLISFLSDPSHAADPPRGTQSPFSPRQTHSFLSSPSQGTSPRESQTQKSKVLGESTEEQEERRRSDEEEEAWGSGAPSPAERSRTPDLLRKSTDQNALRVQDSPECRSCSAPPPSLSSSSPAVAHPAPGKPRGALALRLGALMSELEETLRNHSGSEKELRGLDQQVQHLATILKNNLSLLRDSSSEETLAVEEVLGSFDFLSHDSNDDDASCPGSLRLKGSGSLQQSTLRRLGQSPSEEELVITTLTSGNWGLDQALETHLDTCCILLQTIRTTDFSPSRAELLQEMSLQAEVLQSISCLLLEKRSVSAADVIPETQRTREVLLFWDECVVDSAAPFCCAASQFCRTLRERFAHKMEADQADAVSSQLLQQLQTSSRSVPSSRPVCSPERVTIFQLSVFLKRWSLQELEEHVARVSREEYILSALRSPKRRRALNKMRGRSITALLPLRGTLQTLAALQVDSNHRVCKAAASCLYRAAGCRAFRSQALVYYTESLKSTDVQIQHGSCLALKCLKATESMDLITDLRRSADEDVCSAARETLLYLGPENQLVFQIPDQLFTEMQEEVYQNQETETTFL
ncbi:RIPOR family member 3 isoform X1 [Clinocottus analis]|uniref:RIPOR family member 3 isoform X1 n=1 Tax=Clinocottus analis TaxID=304258 RepID=UPI0035C25B85